MKAAAPRRNDGGRKRCSDCGHPKLEHREPHCCSVPKCKCEGYSVRELRVGAKDAAANS